MNISFSGIKDIMYHRESVCVGKITPNLRSMQFQLTNDEKGNDLKEFRNAIFDSPIEDLFFYGNKEENIELEYSCFSKHECRQFKINDYDLEFNKQTEPIFKYFYKLMDKISKMNPDDFDTKFSKQPEADSCKYLRIDENFEYEETEPKYADIRMENFIFDKDMIKKGAVTIKNGILKEHDYQEN